MRKNYTYINVKIKLFIYLYKFSSSSKGIGIQIHNKCFTKQNIKKNNQNNLYFKVKMNKLIKIKNKKNLK